MKRFKYGIQRLTNGCSFRLLSRILEITGRKQEIKILYKSLLFSRITRCGKLLMRVKPPAGFL
jgi:hypothetical protein